MLVADNTAIAHLHLQNEHGALALAAYQRDPDWITVPLWRYEFSNVLWKLVRAGRLSPAAANAGLRRALQRMIPQERQPDHVFALELALEHQITGYDAHYVALAQSLALPLLTNDGELLKKFPGLAVSLAAFTAA
ncbi:MAG: PIN domain-containing protein [Opitutus sp.]|nr:PIN domain-containing protein [Betaproteobacteria bacterium]MSU23321.1 PIN domain-containing protein [Opitutus sp.]